MAENHAERLLAKADIQGLVPGCMLEKIGLVMRLLSHSPYTQRFGEQGEALIEAE